MSRWRRHARRTRLFVQALIATAIILLAIAVGVARLALPWIAAHPQHIAHYLSERLNRPVSIGVVDGVWERNGPLLSLRDVRLESGKPGQRVFVIPQAELKVTLFAWAHRHRMWTEFRLLGLDLDLARDAAGNWTLSGLDTGNNGGDAEDNPLFNLGGLVLRKLKLRIDDAMSGRHFEFAADEVRLLNIGSEHRVGARLRSAEGNDQPPVDFVVRYDSETQDGETYIGGQNLDLAALLHGVPLAGANLLSGKGRVQVWSTWRANRLTEVRAEVDVNTLVLEAAQPVVVDGKTTVAPRSAFDRIAFGARVTHEDGDAWTGDVADLIVVRQGIAAPPAQLHGERRARENGTAYTLAGERIDLSAPVAFAVLSDALPPGVRTWLYAANPDGTIDNATLRFESAQDYDVAATLANFSWHPVGAVPGVDGLGGRLLGDQDALTFALPAHTAFGIELPKVFRRQFQFTEFSGTIAAYRVEAPGRDGSGTTRPSWRVETDALAFEGDRYGGELCGAVDLHDDGSRPALDAYAAVTHAEVPASHLFWPISTMPPPAVNWLDRALDAGRVTAGRAAIHGDLADWPFRNFSGRFEARAEIDDLRLKYLGDWPAAEHLHVAADFVNVSLHVDADGGSVQGVKVNNATADISELGDGQLEVGANAQGSGADLLGFLKATPVGQRFGAQLLGVDIGGDAKVDVRLSLPLKHSVDFKLAGTANLANSDLSDAKYGLRLDKANGRVRFGRDGFSADDLHALFEGQPAAFSLLVGGFTADPHHAVEASLQTNAAARSVIAYAPALQPYAEYLNGNADWVAAFSADNDAGKPGTQRITVNSNLRGVAIALPEPLRKEAERALPLSVTLGLPFAGGSLDLQLGDSLRLHGRLPTLLDPFAASVAFGAGAPAPLPTRGFLIDGEVPHLDLSGWMDFATGGSGSGSGSGASDNGMIAGIDLNAASLTAYERDFGATRFGLKTSRNGLDLAFKGEAIDGSMHVPAVDLRKTGITAEFAKLHFPELPDSAESGSLSSENPAALPPLHIHVSDFRLGAANFGEATVESYPSADGAHFEQVSTHSDNVEMRARGDWTGRPGADRSRFLIDFSARNLGRMLDAFGNAGVVDGGATVAHIDGSWSGAPSAFALARLDGTLKVSVKQGRIPEYDPGAARVLGLLNLAAIPRRLAFDFGDLFKSGYSFDSIEGLFTLKDGNAYTGDLLIKSPTADMKMVGRTGLKAKDWDQTVEVTPHVSATFAIGGGLLGGPIGAAAGMLFQGVFRNQIAEVTRAEYKITGSWKEPTIVPIAREGRRKTGQNATPAPPKRG
ncbi:MAG TPA: YhdP family protein [Rudaea sp.]